MPARSAIGAATVTIIVDDSPMHVASDTTVAAALVTADRWAFRRAVSGALRGPLCGMGTCYECRVTVDGIAQQRACLTRVAEGMRVRTGAGQ